MKQVLIAVDDFIAEHRLRITDAVKSWAVIEFIAQASSESTYRDALKNRHVCVGWPAPEWVLATDIGFLQIGSSGWDAYSGKGLEQKNGFALCTGKGIYSTGLAEHAIAMMLALVRRIPMHVNDKAKGLFRRHLPFAPEITGTTGCIIGMGHAGRLLAPRLKGLGMKVIAVTRENESLIADADESMAVAHLKEAVKKSDHIFLLVPGTAANKKLFSRSVLEACKPSAFFYNLSRGSNVDEEALYELLTLNKLAGAGLDVMVTEPLPADSKWWTLGDQVLITGHSAGLSAGYPARFCDLAIRNLNNYQSQLPMENRVI